uniref:RIKEN cDNA 2610028H24 gene n=1 Tax=Jaculus jaculus TaxID=51337 RepID=A0A8C5KJG4_JACJA
VMMDSSVADQMTRLTLKLLEQKLEQERESVDKSEHWDRPDTALQSALRRRKDLLQRLWEQQLMDEYRPAHAWREPHKRAPMPALHPDVPPAGIFPAASSTPPLPSEPPRIIQHPMVEMMLMQNAQMHQILMQNMMLKALPPGFQGPHPSLQDPRWARLGTLRAERQKPSPVHHHHHYAPPASLQAGAAPGTPVGYSGWLPVVSATALPPVAGFLPPANHITSDCSSARP